METAASFRAREQLFNPLNKQPDRSGGATHELRERVHPVVYILAEHYFSSYYTINTNP